MGVRKITMCLFAAVSSVALAGPLHDAAGKEDVEAVVQAAAGADLNQRDKKGQTPLTRAAEAGHLAVVARLLELGADPNRTSSQKDEDDEVTYWTPLAHAAVGRHLDVMELLLRSKADIKDAREQRLPPMQAAARGGSIECLELLRKNGAPIDAPDGKGRTPFLLAVAMGQKDAANWLLEHRADLRHRDSWGQGAITWAAQMGRTEMIRMLIARGLDVNETTGDRHCISNAANGGHWETVKALLELGVDINAPDHYRHGPALTQAAAAHGDVEMLQWLMARGAKMHAQRSLSEIARGGHTAMLQMLIDMGYSFPPKETRYEVEVALKSQHAGTAKLLLHHCRQMLGSAARPEDAITDRVIAALAAGDAKALETTLREGSLLDLTLVYAVDAFIEESGDPELSAAWNPFEDRCEAAARQQQKLDEELEAAATKGDLPLIRDLIAQGANPDAYLHGSRPLFEAISSKQTEAVRLLLELGARDVRTRGDTALREAIAHGTPEIIELLLESGASLDWLGVAVGLRRAVGLGNAATVTFLLDKGFSPNAVVHDRSLLMHAAAGTNLQMVKLLLDRGADPRLEVEGETAMSVAVEEGRTEIAQALQRAGAKGDASKAAASIRAGISGGPTGLAEALKAGANPNEWIGFQSALEVVVEDTQQSPEDRLRMFQMLLEKGASPREELMRHFSFVPELIPYLRAMLKHGVSPEAKSGDAPLLVAIQWRNAPAVEALLEAGARLDVKLSDGSTVDTLLESRGTPEIRSMVAAAQRKREAQK